MKKWGTGHRKTNCDKCNQTGKLEFKPTYNNDIAFYKFWFNIDSGYITTTYVDGTKSINPNDIKSYNIGDDIKSKLEEFIYNPDRADKTRVKLIKELEKKVGIENESKLLIHDKNDNNIIGTLYIDRNREIWFVNRESFYRSYRDEPVGNDFRKYGNYAYRLSELKFNNYDINIIELKDDYIYYNKRLYNAYSYEHTLENANFAIVLDLEKLININYTPVNDIRKNRIENRKGAISLQLPEDIKKMNIKRYMDKLTNVDIENGLEKFFKLLPILFRNEYSLYFIMNREVLSKFNTLYSYITSYLQSNDEVYISAINNRVKELYELSNNYKSFILRHVYNNPSIKDDVEKIKIANEILEIGKIIGSGLFKEMEFFEDLEILKHKISMITNKCESSSSYTFLEFIRDCDYYKLIRANNEQTIKTLETLKLFLSRLVK